VLYKWVLFWYWHSNLVSWGLRCRWMGPEASGEHSTDDWKHSYSSQKRLLQFDHNSSTLQLDSLCYWLWQDTNGIWHGTWWSACYPKSWVRLYPAMYSICSFLRKSLTDWHMSTDYICHFIVSICGGH
jgi:hypothetical protein